MLRIGVNEKDGRSNVGELDILMEVGIKNDYLPSVYIILQVNVVGRCKKVGKKLIDKLKVMRVGEIDKEEETRLSK